MGELVSESEAGRCGRSLVRGESLCLQSFRPGIRGGFQRNHIVVWGLWTSHLPCELTIRCALRAVDAASAVSNVTIA